MSTTRGIQSESLGEALGLRVEAAERGQVDAAPPAAGAAAEPQVEAALLLGEDVERQQPAEARPPEEPPQRSRTKRSWPASEVGECRAGARSSSSERSAVRPVGRPGRRRGRPSIAAVTAAYACAAATAGSSTSSRTAVAAGSSLARRTRTRSSRRAGRPGDAGNSSRRAGRASVRRSPTALAERRPASVERRRPAPCGRDERRWPTSSPGRALDSPAWRRPRGGAARRRDLAGILGRPPAGRARSRAAAIRSPAAISSSRVERALVGARDGPESQVGIAHPRRSARRRSVPHPRQDVTPPAATASGGGSRPRARSRGGGARARPGRTRTTTGGPARAGSNRWSSPFAIASRERRMRSAVRSISSSRRRRPSCADTARRRSCPTAPGSRRCSPRRAPTRRQPDPGPGLSAGDLVDELDVARPDEHRDDRHPAVDERLRLVGVEGRRGDEVVVEPVQPLGQLVEERALGLDQAGEPSPRRSAS